MIAFDASATGTTGSGATISWSHTCTGSNLILWVFVEGGNANTTDITGVTYNSVALTKANAYVNNQNRGSYLWYLINPATGTNTVTVSNSSGAFAAASSCSYTGVKQSGQPDSSGTGTTASGTSVTASTTVVASGCWLVGGTRFTSASPVLTAGAGTTKRASSSAEMFIGDSNGTVSTGSQSLVFNNAETGVADAVVCSFAPATSTPTSLASLGVG